MRGLMGPRMVPGLAQHHVEPVRSQAPLIRDPLPRIPYAPSCWCNRGLRGAAPTGSVVLLPEGISHLC